MIVDEDDAQISNCLNIDVKVFTMWTMHLPAWKGEIQNNFFLSIEFFLGVLPENVFILRTKVKGK